MSGATLQRLAAQRPEALGLATEGAFDAESIHVSIMRDEESQMLLVEQGGRMRPWL